MKIGELSSATHTPVETIRYYEREGLLPAPARSEGNFCLYGESHVGRLQPRTNFGGEFTLLRQFAERRDMLVEVRRLSER